MKTTLIISAALLFSLASIAQTDVKNRDAAKDATTLSADKGSSKLSGSGSASSSTTVQSNAVPAVKNTVAAKSEKAKEAIVAGKKEATAPATAGVQSNSKTTIDGKSNKTSEKTSINDQVMTSPMQAKATGSQLKEESKTAVAHTTKPRPASIKTNAKVKVNTAIRIK